MSNNRKRRVNALEPHLEIVTSKDGDGVEKSKKRSVQKQFKKATGEIENDEHSSPSSKGEAFSSSLEFKTTKFVDERAKLPVLDLKTDETLHRSAKIKLQLFPIDERTRLGLEKDGFHPYLELTLSARKKISSVLKHLESKWAGSSIAVGEPMLFPYDVAEILVNHRWTRNDSCISARDVHRTIGSPAVFRLRYGWMSETEKLGQYSVLDPFDVQKDICLQKAYSNCEKADLIVEEPAKPVITREETDAVVTMDHAVRKDSGDGLLSVWADSLTNISIGGLLSEVSLQGKSSNCDPKSNGSKEGLQSSQLISDSFDAFLAGQFNLPQNPGPPPQVSLSSILDAEDTCHAFSFQKSNVESQGHGCQQSEADLLVCSRVNNDESSLAFSCIKWTDSLGPFNLGPSSSRKIISENDISLSSFAN